MHTFFPILIVGAGGFVGAVLRYGVGLVTHRASEAISFPLGAIVVNVAGCFAAGLLVGVAEARVDLHPNLRLFLMVGLLGGFTTFSAFGYEALALARDGLLLRAALYIIVTLVLTLAAVGGGYLLSRMWP